MLFSSLTNSHHRWQRRLALGAGMLGLLGLLAAPAQAQNAPGGAHAGHAGHAGHANHWPTKPVRLLVTLSPGSTSDILARTVADQLSKSLGQSFVVENRPGAGGNIAGEVVARSAADGYTLLLATISSHGINPALYARMPYDALRDFVPVINLASSPNALIVGMDVPVNSVSPRRTSGPGPASSTHASGRRCAGRTSRSRR